jgi:hypothetical protein
VHTTVNEQHYWVLNKIIRNLRTSVKE